MKKTIWVNGDEFILVEAENLSLDDDFMKYVPRTYKEDVTKQLISETIRIGVKNFYRPKCDPSFSRDGESICFVPGNLPAVGKTITWWNFTAIRYSTERNSRLGTYIEYLAFLGVLIKKLVEEGNSVEWAWNAVCNDSRKLGHYWNSRGARHNFETTGSRCVCGYCDLANTYKMLAKDMNAPGYWVVGGNYNFVGYCAPLASFEPDRDLFSFNEINYIVGWVILEK